MIISGGVNIYPQECENLLITHPKVADAAVFGVPNEDLGEEVKAVVQPMPGVADRAGAGGRADRLLPRAAGPHEVPAHGRLHRRAAAPAHRQALQAPAARRLLGQPHARGSSERTRRYDRNGVPPMPGGVALACWAGVGEAAMAGASITALKATRNLAISSREPTETRTAFGQTGQMRPI